MSKIICLQLLSLIAAITNPLTQKQSANNFDVESDIAYSFLGEN